MGKREEYIQMVRDKNADTKAGPNPEEVLRAVRYILGTPEGECILDYSQEIMKRKKPFQEGYDEAIAGPYLVIENNSIRTVKAEEID